MKVREINVGHVSDFSDPGRKVVDIGGTEVGVFLHRGKFTAFFNVCPHMGGPVCQGKMVPRTLEAVEGNLTSSGRKFSDTHLHVACPWHGYEFDVDTGAHPGNSKVRLRPVDVKVRDAEVWLILPAREKGAPTIAGAVHPVG